MFRPRAVTGRKLAASCMVLCAALLLFHLFNVPLSTNAINWASYFRSPPACTESATSMELRERTARWLFRDPAAGDESQTRSSNCPAVTGWWRVIELYMGHWDVVNVIAVSDSLAEEARDMQQLALCAAPLVLNTFGAPSVVQCGEDDGWFSVDDGCAAERYDGAPLGSTIGA